MHSFYLPHSEMTITLEDMEVIIGVPVDGLPVVGYTSPRTSWFDACAKWLGLKYENSDGELRYFDLTRKPNKAEFCYAMD